MPRPASKSELLSLSASKYDALTQLVASMTDDERVAEFAFDDRDRNVRDVLVHLVEWHRMLLAWAAANLAGERKPFLTAPYTWATYQRLNVEFRDRNQAVSLHEAQALLEDSNTRALALVESLSDEELFTKRYFDWSGTTSVGSYCVSALSSHYDWALKKLRKHRKTYVSL
ncbi:ClbS/DfsB family four-helix bundle protein [Agromyces protaetiae]|uniref:ClbS/DfsB family four-helix bundle protein n=1 Tax=Agromyces protaetiae TaxID=2509455 RepID=A0A4P6FA05_9MICO|nr:ClbS/DfsB family four-helix bundle protein [Agromyces protaetiae]QAY72624.1 ClbS/DfsB family four-helix bundle protein [Agromyces protaetiae]